MIFIMNFIVSLVFFVFFIIWLKDIAAEKHKNKQEEKHRRDVWLLKPYCEELQK